MKSFKLLLLSASVAIITACNSSSSKSPTSTTPTTPTTPTAKSKPAADYNFSDAEVSSLLEERNQILQAMRLTFKEKTYSNLTFAEQISDEQTVLKLKDEANNSIDLLINTGGEGNCAIYTSDLVDVFKCSESMQSSSGERTLIQSTTENSKQSIQLEFVSKAVDVFASVGSTILTATQGNNEVHIATSFAFNKFYAAVLGLDGSDERINSTLGVTTYLQLRDIVSQYKGTKMTLEFRNHIGGSADDDINMYTGLMINSNSMTTSVASTGSVFSGGTDLFAAGNPRVLHRAKATNAIEANQQIGVHSWGNGEKTALEIPFTDDSHRKQATYFNKVLGEKGVDFYLFTLESAPFNGSHWITKADSDKYGFITQIN